MFYEVCLLNEMVCLALENLLCGFFFMLPFFWQVQAEEVIFYRPGILFHALEGICHISWKALRLTSTDLCFSSLCQVLSNPNIFVGSFCISQLKKELS